MTYACAYDVPGDEEFYRRVATEIGKAEPEGLITHLVVKIDGGLRHIEVWSSEADWTHYRTEQVLPALRRVFASLGLGDEIPEPPMQPLDVVDIRTGTNSRARAG